MRTSPSRSLSLTLSERPPFLVRGLSSSQSVGSLSCSELGHDHQQRRPPSPEQLSDLRRALVHRFGSLEHAFETMDFFRNDRVSCLEFQEVVNGQMKHCSLAQAQNLFRHLTRGCDGWMCVGDLIENLMDRDPPSLTEGCSSVLGSSRSVMVSAADALKSLMLGKDQETLGCNQQASVRSANETLGLSGAGPVPAARSGKLPNGRQYWKQACNAKAPGWLLDTSKLSWDASRNHPTYATRPGLRVSGHGHAPSSSGVWMQNPSQAGEISSSIGGAMPLWAQYLDAQSEVSTVLSASTNRSWATPVSGFGYARPMSTPGRGSHLTSKDASSPAAEFLDRGLQTWRQELQLLKQDLSADGWHVPTTNLWLKKLQPESQRRLQACSTPEEALQVLEELAGPEEKELSIFCRSRSKQEHILEGVGHLLAAARQRTCELEETLKAEQRKHKGKLAHLKSTQPRRVQEALRRLAAELDPALKDGLANDISSLVNEY